VIRLVEGLTLTFRRRTSRRASAAARKAAPVMAYGQGGGAVGTGRGAVVAEPWGDEGRGSMRVRGMTSGVGSGFEGEGSVIWAGAALVWGMGVNDELEVDGAVPGFVGAVAGWS